MRFLVTAFLLAGLAVVATRAPADDVNVRALGAAGDGNTDDTVAFRAAIAKAIQDRSDVYVPKGLYRLSEPLVLENLTLKGPEGGAWPADGDALPVLLPAHRDGPCLELRAGGSVRGLGIRYEWDKEPEGGPPAIVISGVGAYISCVKIQYPWDGIMADGASNVGRLNVENVFIVSPRNIGVRVTGTWDIPTLRNIEVWNLGPVPRAQKEGIGFDLGKNDLLRLTDCFVFAMGYGYRFRDEIPGCTIKGGTWGIMTGCSSDFCIVGISVEGEHTIGVTGGSYWQHQQSLKVDGARARLRVTGAELKSNGSPCVEVLSSDHVIMSGCSLLRPMEEYPGPAVHLKGGRTILQGCFVRSVGEAIRAEGGAVLSESANILEPNYRPPDDKKSDAETSGAPRSEPSDR